MKQTTLETLGQSPTTTEKGQPLVDMDTIR
jgi:hypothetical protein